MTATPPQLRWGGSEDAISESALSHDRSDQQGAIVGDAVGLAPDAHGAGLEQGAVAGAEQHLAAERNLEPLVGTDHPQRMPLVLLVHRFLASDLPALATFPPISATIVG